MSQYSAEEDQGGSADPQVSPLPDSADDILRPLVIGHPRYMVGPYDHQTCQGQQIQDPSVLLPQSGHIGNHHMEYSAYYSHCDPHHQRKQQPFPQRQGIIAPVPQLFFHIFHVPSLCFRSFSIAHSGSGCKKFPNPLGVRGSHRSKKPQQSRMASFIRFT